MVTTLLVIVIILAIGFDFINGFHDAANSIATIVSTKVLTPFQAVLWAATFNFAAYFYFTDHKVADTVAKTVYSEFITLEVVLSGLIAAIAWNLLTWYYGIPSSSSHTLIGGFAGAGMAKAITLGQSALVAVNFTPIIKVVSFIVLAPIIGMIIAIIINLIIINISKNARPATAEKWFKRLQLVSSAGLSFTHGGNDAQKVMGIIFTALVANKVYDANEPMPEWYGCVCCCCYFVEDLLGTHVFYALKGWSRFLIMKLMQSNNCKIFYEYKFYYQSHLRRFTSTVKFIRPIQNLVS